MTQRRTASSTVAIGTASIFLALAALVGALSDDAGALGHRWSLRGALLTSAKTPRSAREG